MRIIHKNRREKGAITVWTALLLTTLVAFTALTVDLGLHAYLGAKLQNAADSAATAVAANIGAADNSLEDVAYDYLAKNGFSKDDTQVKNLKVTIDPPVGVLTEQTLKEDNDAYITSGFYKVTVEVDNNTMFGKVLDIDSLHLVKTSYVRAEANYVEMPKALKYTVFAGSTVGTEANPAVKLNGRTGTVVNGAAGAIENTINGFNQYVVQPIKVIFGGTANWNTAVNINLSEIVANGDVHSNSNILIGVQALNVSRTKDRDFKGDDSTTEETSTVNSAANSASTTETNNDYDDYGQVTFTAVKEIDFKHPGQDSGFWSSSTHVYVQNQQYLERTQAVLNVLDKLKFNEIASQSQLEEKYAAAATAYLEKHPNIAAIQQTAIQNAVAEGYLDYNGGNLRLQNQGQIVYNINHQTAKSFMDAYRNPSNNGFTGLLNDLSNHNIDPLYKANNSSELRYENNGDGRSDINYSILFDHTAKSDATTKELTVTGTTVHRNYTVISERGTPADATTTGAKFALARTFMEDSEYIPIPNLKPYFTRQINDSIRNATKTRENHRSTDGYSTTRAAIAATNSEFESIYDYADTNTLDNTYSSVNDADSTKKTALMFSKLINGSVANSSTTFTELTGDNHTTYFNDRSYQEGRNYFANGKLKLYKSNGELKKPTDFIEEFKNQHLNTENAAKYDYGAGAVVKFASDNQSTINANKVAQKKSDINNSATVTGYNYNDKKDAVKETIKAESKPEIDVNATGTPPAPQTVFIESADEVPTSPSDVFLGDGGKLNIGINAKRVTYNNAMDFGNTSSNWSVAAIPGTNKALTSTISSFISGKSNCFSAMEIINAIQAQYSWNGYGASGDNYERCNYDGVYTTSWGSANGEYHHVKNQTYYKRNGYPNTNNGKARGFVVDANKYFWATDYLKTGGDNDKAVVVRGVLMVGSNSTSYNGGYHTVSSTDRLWSKSGLDVLTNGFVAVNGNVYVEQGLLLQSGSFMIVDGNINIQNGIEVQSGAVLIVRGNIYSKKDITNSGTIIYTGDCSIDGRVDTYGYFIGTGSGKSTNIAGYLYSGWENWTDGNGSNSLNASNDGLARVNNLPVI